MLHEHPFAQTFSQNPTPLSCQCSTEGWTKCEILHRAHCKNGKIVEIHCHHTLFKYETCTPFLQFKISWHRGLCRAQRATKNSCLGT